MFMCTCMCMCVCRRLHIPSTIHTCLQTVQLSKREQADRAAHEKWAQERAAQLAAAATPDKDARIATLENNVRQLEASLAERAEVCCACTCACDIMSMCMCMACMHKRVHVRVPVLVQS